MIITHVNRCPHDVLSASNHHTGLFQALTHARASKTYITSTDITEILIIKVVKNVVNKVVKNRSALRTYALSYMYSH